jgi:hypothetical protein
MTVNRVVSTAYQFTSLIQASETEESAFCFLIGNAMAGELYGSFPASGSLVDIRSNDVQGPNQFVLNVLFNQC